LLIISYLQWIDQIQERDVKVWIQIKINKSFYLVSHSWLDFCLFSYFNDNSKVVQVDIFQTFLPKET